MLNFPAAKKPKEKSMEVDTNTNTNTDTKSKLGDGRRLNKIDRSKTGRKVGTANKATKEIKDMIAGALSDVGGQAYLAAQAIDNPVAFMGLIGKILPKDIKATLDGNIILTSITRRIIDGHGD